MGIFRRRTVNNVAVTASPPIQARPPEPRPQNHSWVGPIFAVFIVIVLSFILAWHAGVYLLKHAGYYQPKQELANWILFGVSMVIILGVVVPAGTIIGAKLIGRILDAKIELEQIRLDAANTRLSLVQQIPPDASTGMTAETMRKYMAIKLTMVKAFDEIDEDGILTTKTEPWSRRSVGSLKLWNDTKPIGEGSAIASAVKRWLLDHRILLDDKTVNVGEYPNISAVEAELIKDFGRPIWFNSPAPTPSQYDSFEHI